MGTLKGDRYTVFLDVDSEGYMDRLARLRKVSEYLADAIACHSDSNGIVFIKSY